MKIGNTSKDIHLNKQTVNLIKDSNNNFFNLQDTLLMSYVDCTDIGYYIFIICDSKKKSLAKH